jgi:eukaryotic-like serine/threonine-protein kinase
MSTTGPIGGDLLARRYRLIDRVGAGGMSVVWRARDEVLDRLVAVKWLGSELADDELFRDLVRREAWATARIKHPAVAAVYDYGEMPARDGQSLAYVVMEMLDGQSLSERLRLGPVPWREAVAICAEIADALATAHEQGVVHRDISPDNVMLTSSGLRVFDFGIAAPIGEPDDDATGSTFGTPAYVAPERLDGQPAQTATDVYSLGVLLFEMLTGAPPFPEDTWDHEAPLRHRDPPRVRGVAGLPAAVARLCQRCLAHEPAARPPAREVADQLAAYSRPWWRGRALVVAATVLVAVVAVLVALSGWGSSPVPPSGAATPEPTPAPTGPAPNPPPTASTAGPPSPSAGSPATTAPTIRPSTAPPTTAPPTVDSIPISQALDELRATITGQVPAGMDNDVALDLRQFVDNIARALDEDPSAAVLPMVDGLREKIRVRSNERDAEGEPRLTTSARDALLSSVARLESAIRANTAG